MASKKLDKIDEQINKLMNQRKLVKTKEMAKQRKQDTRRKVILGAFLMHWMETDEKARRHWEEHQNGFLTRDVDRELFGLAQVDDDQNKAVA